MKIEFLAEKATKNTIRFAEIPNEDSGALKIGTVYIPKATLGVIGWADGRKLVVDLSTGGTT